MYIRVWCPEKPNLDWLLITNLAVDSEKDALRIIKIYRRRWLIEDYHKAVKTGFRIEDNQLKQASRIFALFGMIAVIATKLLAINKSNNVEKIICKKRNSAHTCEIKTIEKCLEFMKNEFPDQNTSSKQLKNFLISLESIQNPTRSFF